MKKSFTLIEILVVATIIGLLAAVSTISYSQLSKQSRDARRKTDLEQIRSALEMYRSNNDQYPTTITINCSSVGGIIDGSGAIYLSSIPKDPKCNIYSYYYFSSDGTDYTLGAYLESGGTNCGGSCGSATCNYCLGPLGQK